MWNPRKFVVRGKSLFKKWSPFLAFLFGMSWLFTKAYAYSMGYAFSFWSILLFVLVFSIPVGYALMYLMTFLIFWVGKIFKGKGSFEEILAAYGWTRLIDMFVLGTWVGFVATFGRYAFTPMLVYSVPMPFIVLCLILVQFTFTIWQVVVLFHAIGEVQGFSAWIAIWNVLFAWALLLMIDGVINWLVFSSFVWKPITTSLIGIL